MCLLSLNALAQERLCFGVISDTHFENGVGEGARVKVPRALKNLTSQAQLDILVNVGDIVDQGKPSEYEMLTECFTNQQNFTQPVGQLLFVMGGHEYLGSVEQGKANYQQGLKSFNGGKPYPLNQYVRVKGYPFISVAMNHWYPNDTGDSSHGYTVYPVETLNWLSQTMEQAAQECPGKPIFVFTHVPTRWSVYGAWPEYENGSAWCMKVLNPILNRYPQTVLFAGHSHYPLGDPRSIHQGANPQSARQNYYTVINTGSTTYGEIHPGAVAEGTHPRGYEYVTEGMILTEQENGDIEIRRYDTYRNEEIGAQGRWVLRAPFDGSRFQYADIRDRDDNPEGRPLRDGLPAPAWESGEELSAKAGAYWAEVTIPQARDNECVFRYRIRVARQGLVVSEKYIFSQFYLNSDTPRELKYTLNDLLPETDYSVEVAALDSYDNLSAPLSVAFTTLSGQSGLSEPDGNWLFDDPADLLKPEGGRLQLQPITIGRSSVSVAATAQEANIRAIGGRTQEDGAIFVPRNSGLKVVRPEGAASTSTWTLLMDIKVKSASPYNGLLQTNRDNGNDGDIFIFRNQIGMGAMGGYFGTVRDDTWHRIVMMNRGGEVRVYLDGNLTLTCGSDSRWEIDPWGFYLFCDDDGEMTDTYVAQVAYWEHALVEDEVRALSGLEPQGTTPPAPKLDVLTKNVRLTDELDFSITAETNVPFTFQLPEWIEPIDITPFAGRHTYTLRAQPLTEGDRRSGTIRLKADGLPDREVPVEQIRADGETVPEETGCWLFDNPDDLLEGTGTASLKAAVRGSNGEPRVVSDPAEAGIVPVEGPSEGNGAATVPIDSYLQMAHNQEAADQNDFTILMDIRPKRLAGYNALFQSHERNEADGSLYTLNNRVGITAGNLGYNGDLAGGRWHRIVFSVESNYITLFVDGTKVGASTSPNSDRWILHPVCYFFCDDDGEEGVVDIAELRYWNEPLWPSQVRLLGAAGNTTAIEAVPGSGPEARSAGPSGSSGDIYNLQGQRLGRPGRGVNIIGKKAVLVM